MDHESVASTPDPFFLTTGEFSHHVRLSISTVKRLCEQGDLAHVVISSRGDRRIPRSEVDRLLGMAEANRQGGSIGNGSGAPMSLPLRTMVYVDETDGVQRLACVCGGAA